MARRCSALGAPWCRGALPRRTAVAHCRGALPRRTAAAHYRGALPWRTAVAWRGGAVVPTGMHGGEAYAPAWMRSAAGSPSAFTSLGKVRVKRFAGPYLLV